MKKTVCFILCVVVLFAFVTVSTAESIDLTSLSFDELQTLQEKISAEIKSRPEWKGVKVPAGIWTVGVDIPEGEYSISMVNEDGTGKMSIWGKAVDDYVTNGGCVYPLVFGYEYKTFGKVYLKDGYIVDSTLETYFSEPLKLGF